MDFCTLFDSNYLTRGLALYFSLKKNCTDFHLYIFAFDDKCKNILLNLSLDFVTVISLNEFENKELLAVKAGRTKAEYCWTCTSSTILYCLKKYDLEYCTYLDADIYFYSNPKCLIDELGKKSVLITRHNYATDYDKSRLSGKYCVQFMTFRNDKDGLKVLRWWIKSCLEWCFNRCEDGKFGDQKYLDDWPSRFEGVHVLNNIGGGVAPWNSVKFTFIKKNNEIFLKKKNGSKFRRLVFFHFHNISFYRIIGFYKYVTNKDFSYRIGRNVKRLIYNPYFREIINGYRLLNIYSLGFMDGLEGWKKYLGNYKVKL